MGGWERKERRMDRDCSLYIRHNVCKYMHVPTYVPLHIHCTRHRYEYWYNVHSAQAKYVMYFISQTSGRSCRCSRQ